MWCHLYVIKHWEYIDGVLVHLTAVTPVHQQCVTTALCKAVDVLSSLEHVCVIAVKLP